MKKQTIHPELQRYLPLVDGIAETFGGHCEVVLHDFSLLPNSIIAIANGHVTGRSIGSPITEYSLEMIKQGDTSSDIINYTGKSFDGKVLKSSTFFIQDKHGDTVGCYCINIDLTEIYAVKKVIDNMVQIQNDTKGFAENGNVVNDVLYDIVIKSVEQAGKPVVYMTKEEKVVIVKLLNNQGAFLIKGAIDYVAKVLCVSRYTIYNYLDEIREEQAKK